MHEREAHVGQMMWTTVLLPSRLDQSSLMSGLRLGIGSGIARDVACYRVIWESLGPQIDLRAALAGTGLYALASPVIPQDVRVAVTNDLAPGEDAFVARPWVNAPA